MTEELSSTVAVTEDDEAKREQATVSRFRRLLPQVIVSMSCNLMVLNLGLSQAFLSLVIGNLLHADGELSLDDNQASWLASIPYICQPFGCFASGIAVEILGRKRPLVLLNVPYLAGFILLSVTNSYAILIFVTAFLGISTGLTETLSSGYMGEVNQPEIRGIMTASAGVFIYLGWLLEYLLGAFMTWRKAIAFSATLPVISGIFLALAPESAAWLIYKNRMEDAKRALCWLRGWVKPEAVNQELEDLMRYHSEAKLKSSLGHKKHNSSSEEDSQLTSEVTNCVNSNYQANAETQENSWHQKLIAAVRDIKDPPTLRPLVLVVLFFFFVNWSGLISISPFMIHVFDEFHMPISTEWTMVISAGVSVLGMIAAMLLVNRLGKRLLSLASTGIMTVLTILLGVYAYLEVDQDQPGEIKPYSWMPLFLFSSMYFINSVMLEMPWMLIAEVFPFKTRGMAAGISAGSSYIFIFLATKTYLDIEKTFRLHGALWFYGCVSVVGFVYLYFKLLETEGRTLEEIETHFTKDECPKTMKKT